MYTLRKPVNIVKVIFPSKVKLILALKLHDAHPTATEAALSLSPQDQTYSSGAASTPVGHGTKNARIISGHNASTVKTAAVSIPCNAGEVTAKHPTDLEKPAEIGFGPSQAVQTSTSL
jgi:hypothetical protein